MIHMSRLVSNIDMLDNNFELFNQLLDTMFLRDRCDKKLHFVLRKPEIITECLVLLCTDLCVYTKNVM